MFQHPSSIPWPHPVFARYQPQKNSKTPRIIPWPHPVPTPPRLQTIQRMQHFFLYAPSPKIPSRDQPWSPWLIETLPIVSLSQPSSSVPNFDNLSCHLSMTKTGMGRLQPAFLHNSSCSLQACRCPTVALSRRMPSRTRSDGDPLERCSNTTSASSSISCLMHSSGPQTILIRFDGSSLVR
jgi:hypothetical protein